LQLQYDRALLLRRGIMRRELGRVDIHRIQIMQPATATKDA
jgi:hypothetical protein